VPAANKSILVNYDVKSVFDDISKILLKINSYLYQLCWCKTKQDLSLVTWGPL